MDYGCPRAERIEDMIIKRADIIRAVYEAREATGGSHKPDNRFPQWVKHVVDVHDLKNGYAFEGPFLEATDEIKCAPAVLLTCYSTGSRRYNTRLFDVVVLGEDGTLTVTGTRTTDDYGKNRYWALDIREQIRGLL